MKYPLAKFSNLPIIIGTKMITWILHPPVRQFRYGRERRSRAGLTDKTRLYRIRADNKY
jgi:hypothetical protein